MTAEIALLNKEAVAIAADSAVTFRTAGGVKILPSANKIFTLSKYHPVGVMVYGNAQLMGAPWELLIKSYRRQLGENSFPYLEDYASDLMRFLSEARGFFPESVQDEYFLDLAEEMFSTLRDSIIDEVEAILSENGQITEPEVEEIATEVIGRMHEAWNQIPAPEVQSKDLPDRIRAKYKERVEALATSVFEHLLLNDGMHGQLVDLAIWITSKFFPRPGEGESGIVVTGYGQNDYYPKLRSYRIEAVVADELIYTEDRHHDVGTRGPSIIPFAQSEMVYTFMEGIEPVFQATLDRELTKVLQQFASVASAGSGLKGDKQTKFLATLQHLAEQVTLRFREKSRTYRREHFTEPSLSVTDMLPKDELAAMAESLVNLTAFRRRLSLDAETVGGPVDVAVISKGDGFIWIKRKHYFSQEMNPHFVSNYFRG